jgi:prepilin-type N-terminal cleavage/methylation domain-containing protein
MRSTKGMTMIEMLVALVVFSITMGAALSYLLSQSRAFNRRADEATLAQNLRFGGDLLQQEIRTAGANVLGAQPIIVYGSNDAFAFNADLVSNVANDISAVYVDVDAPAGQVQSLRTPAMTISGSSPGFAYPTVNYEQDGINGSAETVTYFFEPDTSTARADDFRLMRQVNRGVPEVLVRNVLRTPSRQFFRYWYRRILGSGAAQLDTVPTTWIPLTTTPQRATVDTGVIGRLNTLRTLEVSYTVTNGLTGTRERTRATSVMIPMPNVTVSKLRLCGDVPIFGQPVVADVNTSGATPVVNVMWPRATDEASGEEDVIRYVLWRRKTSDPWSDEPYASIPSGENAYVFTDSAVEAGATYEYQIAAQDCTPRLSPRTTTNAVVIPT